jgi:ABC-type branched-subunit amino acid transport system substrate-binding protein
VRALALLAALLLSCTTPTTPSPTPFPTREPGALSVAVLLDLSGQRAPSGQAQRNAMQLWLDQVQSGPLKVRAKFVDVAGSDTKLLLELRRAVVEDRVDALVVGVPVVLDGPIVDAIRVAAVPVLFTLPIAEPAATPAGPFAFGLAPSPDAIARAIVSDLVDRALLQPTLLAGDESRASILERGLFLGELRRWSSTAPSPVSLDTPDGPQRVRSASAFAKSIVLTGASAPYGDLIRSIPVALAAPRVYLSYLTESADVTNLRDQSVLVTWPGSRVIGRTPATAAGVSFVQRFTDRFGPPSTLAATAYDALALIDAAASTAPTEMDAARLRQRLEATTFAGIATRYTFSSARHVGFGTDDLTLLRWDAQRGSPYVASLARVGTDQ